MGSQGHPAAAGDVQQKQGGMVLTRPTDPDAATKQLSMVHCYHSWACQAAGQPHGRMLCCVLHQQQQFWVSTHGNQPNNQSTPWTA